MTYTFFIHAMLNIKNKKVRIISKIATCPHMFMYITPALTTVEILLIFLDLFLI